MWFQRPSDREQAHKRVVLENLARLKTLATAQGGELDFEASWPVAKLENLLWQVIEHSEKRFRLSFPDAMPCEQRIEAIKRALPRLQMPRPASTGDRRRYDLLEHLAFR
jgi:hypothetical protein